MEIKKSWSVENGEYLFESCSISYVLQRFVVSTALIMAYVNARDVGNVGPILSSVFSTIGHPLMRRHPPSVGGSPPFGKNCWSFGQFSIHRYNREMRAGRLWIPGSGIFLSKAIGEM